jgi:hypothetical protein
MDCPLRKEAVPPDAIVLHCQAKQAHWNVKGSHFIQLHELFDTLASDVFTFFHVLADRATALAAKRLVPCDWERLRAASKVSAGCLRRKRMPSTPLLPGGRRRSAVRATADDATWSRRQDRNDHCLAVRFVEVRHENLSPQPQQERERWPRPFPPLRR